jgi:hypothetical protein
MSVRAPLRLLLLHLARRPRELGIDECCCKKVFRRLGLTAWKLEVVDWKLGQMMIYSLPPSRKSISRYHAKSISHATAERDCLPLVIPTLFTHNLQLAKTSPPQLLKAGLHLPSKTTTCQTFPNSIAIPMVKPKIHNHKPNSHPSSPQSTQFFGYRNWHPEHPILGRCGTYTGDGSELYLLAQFLARVVVCPTLPTGSEHGPPGFHGNSDHWRQLRGVKEICEMR